MDDFFLGILALTPADNWQVYLLLLGFILGAANVYEKVDAVRHRNKQNPPLTDIFATKEAVLDMEARFNRTLGGIQSQIDSLDTTLQNELREVNRSLGTIEGTLGMIESFIKKDKS